MTTKPLASEAFVFPVSFAQQRLWILDQLSPGSAAYNLPAALRMTGRLDVWALIGSLNEVVQRHEVLRTTFGVVDGQPVQVIMPRLKLVVPVLDLQGVMMPMRAEQVQQLAIDEARRPFDLAQGPLLRAHLLWLAEAEHILLITLHHIISDGWSTSVLISELTALYPRFAAAQPSPLSELPIQYADYTAWQRGWLQEVLDETGTTRLAQQLEYWREQLSNLPTLDLPTDLPRPLLPSYRGSTVRFELSGALIQALNELSQREGVTLFMVLLAALNVLLSRYTGQMDLAVGSAIANRTQAEMEGLIGFFVNTLVLRTRLVADLTVRDLLAHVREVCLEAYAHQDLPFELLVEALQPERELNRNPLFQVALFLQNMPRAEPMLPGLTFRPLHFQYGMARFDLEFQLREVEGRLEGELTYCTDLFEAATISRMVGHFQRVLEGIVADPNCRLASLPLLTDTERVQILSAWNNTQASYPIDKSLPELFEAPVKQLPDAVALIFEDQHLTYTALNARANQLAHYLKTFGVGPETLVGVCLERSVELIVSLMGILKAGGAYLPLDPTYPIERLGYMLADSKASVLLTQTRLRSQLPEHTAHTLCLDTDWPAIARYPAADPPVPTTADHLAYVLYTSGSTGQPKGVLGIHRGAVNRFAWMWATYPFTPGEVACQKTALSFVDSVWELFGPLLQGVPLVLIPASSVASPAELIARLAQASVTRIVVVPSFLRLLLDTFPDLSRRVPKLRLWIVSGEPLSLDLSQRFHAVLPDALLLNLYGSSEVAGDVTAYEVRLDERPRSIPIGQPIANTQVYLLDRWGQPVPVGVPGEVYVGGVNLARGYQRQPDLTAERFIPNPFSATPGARLYRTGDMAQWRISGCLEYLGRADQQVKVRGFRIELGEIEAVLQQHPAVQVGVVVARADQFGEQQLVAYVVLQGRRLTAGVLQEWLRERLPLYMVPTAFAFLDTLPLTPSGKVDRRALPEPRAASTALDMVHVPPRNEVEELLVGLWSRMLGVEVIGIYDNFFHLGGHSLLATRVLAQVQAEYQVDVPLLALFESPTIAHLAHVIETAQTRNARPSANRIRRVPREQYQVQMLVDGGSELALPDDVRARLKGNTGV